LVGLWETTALAEIRAQAESIAAELCRYVEGEMRATVPSGGR
jgi:hypothetical protein